nr:hypothetical protein [Catenuloplanes japonicus]
MRLVLMADTHVPKRARDLPAEVWDAVAPGGLRLLNPGSPTDRRRQPHRTYLTAVVEGGALGDVTLHRL